MSKPFALSTGAALPVASALLRGLGTSLPAQANNGVQLPAYGAKAMGMAGVSIALPQDAAASANNPVGMALLGDRFDADLTLLRAPIRTEVGSNHYADDAVVAVPTGGFNRVIDEDMSAGLSVFGQGIALDYGEPVFGTHDLKSSLQQVVLAPTVTWRRVTMSVSRHGWPTSAWRSPGWKASASAVRGLTRPMAAALPWATRAP